MNAGIYLGATGFALIAICYGFARFAFGLFLPQIDAELSLSSTLGGLISGAAFFSYCIAIVLSAYLTERIGARFVAISAALVAALGMAGIAMAPSASWLAGAVMLAGSSTGLISPPMAAAVAAIIRPNRQSATNTFINAGTSAGVVLSGLLALLIADQWRLAFSGFAASAVCLGIAAAFSIPVNATKARKNVGEAAAITSTLWPLILATFMMGFASTAIWSFGGLLLTVRLNCASAGAGVLWTAIGSAGIAGTGAGSLVARFGIDRVHRFLLTVMAVSILFIGIDGTSVILTLCGGVLFGAAYIFLTGIYLVWGVKAMPHRPATGLMVGFLTISIGQAAGAPIFGLLMDWLTINHAVAAFACLALTAGLARAKNVKP